jgi:arsenate reductase (thioredoxin)
MAEAFLRSMAGERFEVHSAGLEPRGIHPLTRQVMAEKGFDLAGQYAKDVKEYLGKVHFGYLITVCAHAEEHCPRTFLGVSQRMYWEFEDPAAFEGTEAEQLEKFRQVRDQIEARLTDWLGSLPA